MWQAPDCEKHTRVQDLRHVQTLNDRRPKQCSPLLGRRRRVRFSWRKHFPSGFSHLLSIFATRQSSHGYLNQQSGQLLDFGLGVCHTRGWIE